MALAVPLLTFSSSLTRASEVQEKAKKSCQDDTHLSLSALRQQCEERKSDQQTKPFKVTVMCNGSYTILEQGPEEQRLLPTTDHMTTEVTSKGGRYSTGTREFNSESLSASVSCNKVTKTTIHGPREGGIPVSVEDCSQLEAVALENN